MSRISCRVIRTLDELQAFSDVWNPLLERSPNNTVFLTWEWISTWCKAYLKGDEPFVVVVECDGKLVAIAPLWRERVRVAGFVSVRRLRFLGTGDVCSDYLDVIADVDNHDEWLRAIWDQLFGPLRGEWDIWDYSDVPSDSRALARFYRWGDEDDRSMAREIVGMTVCPYMPLPKTGLVGGLSKKRRYAVNHSRQLLEQQGALTFHHCLDPADVEPELRRLAELNTRIWTERGHKGSFATEEFGRFHSIIADEMLAKERLLLCSLWSGDRYLGAFYGFVYNRVLSYYIMSVEQGRESRANVGDVLLLACMEEAIRRGCCELDFLRGDEYYKYLWTRTDRRNITISFSNKTAGAALYHLGQAFWASVKYAGKGLLKLRRPSSKTLAAAPESELSRT
jgi:CelD/BcsL family acetyltransferase involved in cellulose biosynthesis